jgi:hypothetical protein
LGCQKEGESGGWDGWMMAGLGGCLSGVEDGWGNLHFIEPLPDQEYEQGQKQRHVNAFSLLFPLSTVTGKHVSRTVLMHRPPSVPPTSIMRDVDITICLPLRTPVELQNTPALPVRSDAAPRNRCSCMCYQDTVRLPVRLISEIK